MQLQNNLGPQIVILEESLAKLEAIVISSAAARNDAPARPESNIQLSAVSLVKEAKRIHSHASEVSATRSTFWTGSDRFSSPSFGIPEAQTIMLRGQIENWRTAAGPKRSDTDVYAGIEDASDSVVSSLFSSAETGETTMTHIDQMESIDSDAEEELDWEILQNLLTNANHFYELKLYAQAEDVFRGALKLSKSLVKSKQAQANLGEAALKLARTCLQQQKLDDSESILLNLIKISSPTEDNSSLVLEASYTLSELYLRKGDAVKAKKYCKRTVAGRRKLFGKENRSTHDAVQLYIFICHKSGETHEADAWSALLPEELREQQWLSLAAFPGSPSSEKPKDQKADQKHAEFTARGLKAAPSKPRSAPKPVITVNTGFASLSDYNLDQKQRSAKSNRAARIYPDEVSPLVSERSRSNSTASRASSSLDVSYEALQKPPKLHIPKLKTFNSSSIIETATHRRLGSNSSEPSMPTRSESDFSAHQLSRTGLEAGKTSKYRTWTNIHNRSKVSAQLISCQSGWLNLLQSNGSQISYPVADMATDDLIYIEREACIPLAELRNPMSSPPQQQASFPGLIPATDTLDHTKWKYDPATNSWKPHVSLFRKLLGGHKKSSPMLKQPTNMPAELPTPFPTYRQWPSHMLNNPQPADTVRYEMPTGHEMGIAELPG